MIDRLWKFFTSLRLTVVCLAIGIALVLFGTFAQVTEGLYQAQERWFRSFFIWWGPAGASWKIPFFPGGYLVGIVLLVNLIAAHIKRFQFGWKKLGIHLTHLGIILLLGGQLATDLLSRESRMTFHEGETKNYSESHMDDELVFAVDASGGQEEVVAIPQSFVEKKGEIRHPKLPFVVRVKEYGANCQIRPRAPMMDINPPPATRGAGASATLIPLPETHTMDSRNIPYAVVELDHSGANLGTWLMSPWLDDQEIKLGNQTYRGAFRFERYYEPYSLTLLKATHEVYPGTTKPKNFQSRIRLDHPAKGEPRETDIYMNNPLRYGGLTFFQFQMGRADDSKNSTLMVVKNPSWLTPYLGCLIVAAGLCWQFLSHLIGFISKRLTA